MNKELKLNFLLRYPVAVVCREHEDGGDGAGYELQWPGPEVYEGSLQAQAAPRHRLQPEERHSSLRGKKILFCVKFQYYFSISGRR